MIRLIYVCFLIIFFISSFAQATYENEWINYAQSYYKIRIAQSGLYRITYDELADAGIPVNTIVGDNFQLFRSGTEYPIYTTTGGTFSNGDFIEFYGQRNDGKLDAKLYDDPNWQLHQFTSLFEDSATYFLTWNSNNNNLRINQVINDLSGIPAKEDHFIYESLNIYNQEFSHGKPYSTSSLDVFTSDFEEGEGPAGRSFSTNSGAYNDSIVYGIPIENIVPGGFTPTVTCVVLGNYDVAHQLSIKVNNTSYINTSYNGFGIQTFSFNVPAANLTPVSSFQFKALNSAVYDKNNVAYIKVDYPRSFDFNNVSKFQFKLNASTFSKYIELENFNNAGTAPILYDLTNNLRIEGIIESGIIKYHLPVSGQGRTLFVTNQSTSNIRNVALKPANFINYNQLANQGDYIIISEKSLLDDGNGNNYVEAYRAYRNTTGYDPIVVMIDQLYDQFAHGVSKHPLAIRNFCQYAIDKWTIAPKHLFIIGKGIEYNRFDVYRSQCLVPTFGEPGSDNMLTAKLNSFIPQLSTGRLSTTSPSDINLYLNKIQEYDANKNLPQTVADKAWMKRIIHLGGGTNANEQNQFKNYLANYENLIEDTAYGGNVFSFFKTSSDPIQISESEQINNLITNGVSLMTFFGHGSTNSFDYSVDDPANYNNQGKYPVIFSNACFTGAIFLPGRGLSEDFVLIENKGAIAFLSSSSYSVTSGLNTFASNFYKALSRESYHDGAGDVIKQAITNISNSSASSYNKMVCQQMTFNGDPAIFMNTHAAPDYVIEECLVELNPSIVFLSDENFELQINTTNIGKAVNDSIILEVMREYPDGSEVAVYNEKIAAPYFQKLITIQIATDPINAFGLNKFTVTIDKDNEVAEISELNNSLSFTTFILSDKIIPVYPYEYSIVSDKNITLKASTATTITPIKEYLFEIDTNAAFNSPLKQSTAISQIGGVLKWQPTINYQDSIVYYWRVALDTAVEGAYNWHKSSFIYIKGSSSGWNQSHHDQYQDDEFTNIKLKNNKSFQFVDDLKELRVVNGNYWRGTIGFDQIAYYLNGQKMHNWKCGGVGAWYVAVFDSALGQPWTTPPGGSIYSETNCKTYDFPIFRFERHDTVDNAGMLALLNDVPEGNYILSYSLNNASTATWKEELFAAFENLGSTKIRDHEYALPYVFFCKKGSSSFPVTEVLADTAIDVIDTTINFFADWGEGYVESTLIGPSTNWKNLIWKQHSLDTIPVDQYSVDIYGVKHDESETILASNITSFDTTLAFIDPTVYPYLKLRYNAYDDSLKTPPQLDYWRVFYDELPEAALNPSIEFSYSDDTLSQGANIKNTIAIENLSNTAMDSILIKYKLIDGNTDEHILKLSRLDSLKIGAHIIADLEASSTPYTADNFLFIEFNPDNDQPEQFHFNNIAFLPIHILTDQTNPLLDVTFDAVHILDGDIVSAKPEIVITLKDENQYLAIDDTSLMKIFLVQPSGQTNQIHFDENIMIFYPANATNKKGSNNNKATIEYRPEFKEDGTYKLIVQGKDKSGNASGDLDYTISFEVVNKPSITNVLNYPNPFTSSTKFVFTLTGSEIPVYLKIQIMTVTGKIVKEISINELGPIHIGRNITQYAWDGRDEFGDPLGNGLYLYRVVTSLDGATQIEHRETSADKYFKSGLGKMYLMR